ncbi:MAG: DMT family transporter [Alphaproteobacteria bacterium]
MQSTSALSWFNSKGYLQGVFWAIMVCLISSVNDVCIRFAGDRLDFFQVAFFRFFFSLITLLPFMLYQGISSFKTNKPVFHSIRAILGFGAISCWCAGVVLTPLSLVSTLAQTVPFFVLPMALFVLREKVGWQRTLATLVGFAGIVITLQTPGTPFSITGGELNIGAMWLILAAILFAASDILNKIMVVNENPLTMLFYFALGTTIIGFYPAWMAWQTPTYNEIFWLVCLGAGANLILFCLLKAFAATDISALQPFRYVELFFAAGFGYALFGEIPTIMTVIGAAVIVPAAFTIAVYETRQQQSKDKNTPDENIQQAA